MQEFTNNRTATTPDDIWLVEHFPVYTQGQAGKPEHLLNPGNIPVIKTDRGGQITYHGPGQIMAYVLADLRRSGRYIKQLVFELEESLITTLALYGIDQACRKPGAPGVYVPGQHDLAKIAALGIKVKQGCTYHGLALNLDLDLAPFEGINPCGYAGLQTVDLRTIGVSVGWQEAADVFSQKLVSYLAP